MATDKPRFTITMDTQSLDRVDDYRYSHRINTQSKAILELVQEGLKMVCADEVHCGCQDLTVQSRLSSKEIDLLKNFRNLNGEGQERLFEYSDDLISSKKYTITKQEKTLSAG